MALRDFFRDIRAKKFGQGTKAADTVLSDKEIAANWINCKNCGELVHKTAYAEALNVCPHCGFHGKLDVQSRIKHLVDDGSFKELFESVGPKDPLKFVDDKPYADRLKAAQSKTGKKEAIVCGTGKLDGTEVAFAIMNFDFIGGSMGSVVGEKLTRIFEYAAEKKLPVVSVSSSGGARMHEGLLSLMQMAKTSAALTKLEEAKLLYVSILTDPTFGGVSASFASLGDLLIAEPGARIGFAGKRVIEETIREKLPKDFQTAEYLLEHGQLDMILSRKEMKDKLAQILRVHGYGQKKPSPFTEKKQKGAKA